MKSIFRLSPLVWMVAMMFVLSPFAVDLPNASLSAKVAYAKGGGGGNGGGGNGGGGNGGGGNGGGGNGGGDCDGSGSGSTGGSGSGNAGFNGQQEHAALQHGEPLQSRQQHQRQLSHTYREHLGEPGEFAGDADPETEETLSDL